MSALLDAQLYDGTAGIGLIMASLGWVSQIEEFRKVARGALEYSRVTHSSLTGAAEHVGLYEGTGGLLYSSSLCAHLLGDSYFYDLSRVVMDALMPPRTEDNDLVSGDAGVIMALVTTYELLGYQRALEIADIYGKKLLDNTWRCLRSIRANVNLYGLAHGLAGKAYSLSRLSALTADENVSAGARAAIVHLTEAFDAESGAWPDNRTLRPGRSSPLDASRNVYWCHGSTGIAIALLVKIEEASLGAYRDAALAHVVNWTPRLAGDPTVELGLCHGISGCWELLSAVRDEPWVPAELGQARALLERRVNSELVDSTKSVVPLSQRPLGLMTGLGGLALRSLRESNPTIPSPVILGRVGRAT